MDYPKQPLNLYDRYSRSYHFITGWRNHETGTLAHLDRDVKASAEQFTRQIAVHDEAAARKETLEPYSHKRWSKTTQQTVEFTITLIGAFTFSTIPQILGAASNRGFLATLAGLVGGAAVAWFTHDRANKGLGVLRCAHSSQSALKILEKRHSKEVYRNSLTEAYYNGRKDLIWEVEAENLSSPFYYDLGGAVLATVLEVAAAFYLTLPAGLMVALLAAGFPAAVIWLSSVFQSERVDFAEWALITARKYENYLPPQQTTPDGLPYIFVSDDNLQAVTVTHARFQYFIAVNTNGIQTPQGAEALALIKLAEQEISDWAEAYDAANQDLLKLQRQELERVADRYAISSLDQTGRRIETVKQEQSQKIDAARQQLEADHQEEQKQLQQLYSNVTQRWDAVRLKAQGDFDRWEQPR